MSCCLKTDFMLIYIIVSLQNNYVKAEAFVL